MDLHEIFNNGRSWPSLKQVSFWRWSRLTFTVNVTVTVAQQSHFGIKLTSTETVRVRYSQSYHRLHSTLTKSRMCSVQWHHPWWPWARFKVKPRDDMFLRGKLSPQWNLFVAAAANNSVHLFHLPPPVKKLFLCDLGLHRCSHCLSAVWDMLINLLKSPFLQWDGKWKSAPESIYGTRLPPKVDQFFRLVGPITLPSFNEIGWLLLQ